MIAGVSGALVPGTLKHLRAQEKSPIKIAIISTLSGPVQIVGQQAKIGAEITLDMIAKDGGVAGRPIEVKYYDDKSRADGAVAALREAVADGHNLLTGTLLSSSILAQIPVLAETKAVMITGAGQAMSFTHENFTRNLFRPNENDYERSQALATLAAQYFPDVDHWISVCTDSQAYIDSYKNFTALAKKKFAKIGKTPTFAEPTRIKLGTTEFRSYLSALSDIPNVGVYNNIQGSDGITFWQQARPFPFSKNIRCVMDQVIDVPIAKALKENVPPNCWTFIIWFYGLHMNNPISKTFYDEYVKRTGDRIPGGWVSYGHFGLASFAQAIRAANGSTDTETMIRTLENIPIETIKGRISYRKEDHQMVSNVDVMHLEGSDEAPGIKVAGSATFPGSELLETPAPGKEFKL
jgi:branched-chain amino acid transport system substrate-binding protein